MQDEHCRRSCRGGLFVAVLGGLVLLSGCRSTPEEALAEAKVRSENPSTNLQLTLTSEPVGADVYGIGKDGEPGTKIGTTPLTLQYGATDGATALEEGAKGVKIWGPAAEETMIYDFALNIFEAAGSISFKCILIKEGYKPCRVGEVIEKTKKVLALAGKRRPDLEGIRKTINVVLQPTPETIVKQAEAATSGGKTAETGRVEVVSEPNNGEVFVDGAFVGNTPCKLTLPPGTRQIEVRLNGYATYKRELKVLSGSETTIKATLERQGQ